jgi:hypothetical protein
MKKDVEQLLKKGTNFPESLTDDALQQFETMELYAACLAQANLSDYQKRNRASASARIHGRGKSPIPEVLRRQARYRRDQEGLAGWAEKTRPSKEARTSHERIACSSLASNSFLPQKKF